MKTHFIGKTALLSGAAIILAQIPGHVQAQSDDFGIWATVSLNKTVNDKWSYAVEGEVRTREDAGEMDCWSLATNGTYKITPWLKVMVGYEFFLDYYKLFDYHDDGTRAKRATYWAPSHRTYVQLVGNVNLGRVNLALRERWQYTYTTKHTVSERFDYDLGDYDGEETVFGSIAQNMLRSRLTATYNPARGPLTPYASIELFNAWALDRTRYTLGMDWAVTRHHTAGLYYRFQDKSHNHRDRYDSHVLGFAYAYNF